MWLDRLFEATKSSKDLDVSHVRNFGLRDGKTGGVVTCLVVLQNVISIKVVKALLTHLHCVEKA